MADPFSGFWNARLLWNIDYQTLVRAGLARGQLVKKNRE